MLSHLVPARGEKLSWGGRTTSVGGYPHCFASAVPEAWTRSTSVDGTFLPSRPRFTEIGWTQSALARLGQNLTQNGPSQKSIGLDRSFLLDNHDAGESYGFIMDLGSWLRGLGLTRYEAAFRENEIDEAILPKLTAEDLREIGVTAVGHRRVLLDAIAALRGEMPPKEENAPSAATEPANKRNPVGGRLPEAERRQLTVMFCDLVDSTALSGRLDPEDMRGVISAYHRCCTELMERNGGFVAKYMGDGVLAYFGYPQAHEHDAERAVRTGLALVEAVPKLETAIARTSLQVRVGIATGLVVVGDLIGAGAAQEQAVVGETPNLAARLQALAEAGTIVIASSTRRLTGGLFEYRDLGGVTLKGFAENVRVWQVLGASAIESRFEAMRTTMTPLVGRDEETHLLLRRWNQAKGGDGQVVLISGEAGIGKSRIAETILQQLSGEPHIRLRYFCSPHHQDSALHPSIVQLERAAGFRREDTPLQRLDKLEAVLARGTNNLSEGVPLLADLLSIPIGDRYPPLNLTPQKRKEKTLQAQLAQVEGLSVQQPVLMAWEDMHWSDPTTRESLDLLIDRVATLRVLVIITFRPEFAPPWIGRPHVTMLNLNRLPPRQRAEMIAHVTGGRALPKEIAEQIVDRTDGVPLFVEELTKAVVESGVLVDSGDHYAVMGPVAPLAIPTSLHASLLARLDRLAPTREVAQIGAALGRQFSHELISAVAIMPQQQLHDSLAQLVQAELIFRRGTPPNAEYTFKHALVQDAAYSTLLRNRRQQLHARIAATLESQFPDIVATQPQIMAQHCTEAGLSEEAIVYWHKSGQQAAARSANREAVGHLTKALDVLHALQETPERAAKELALQRLLGTALMATRGHAAPETAAAFGRARELCRTVSDNEDVYPVLSGVHLFELARANLATAREIAEDLLARAERAGNDPELHIVAHQLAAVSYMHIGALAAATRHQEQAVRLCETHPPAASHAFRFGYDTPAATYAYAAWCQWLIGHPERAVQLAKQVLARVDRMQHPFTTLRYLYWSAVLHQLFGEWSFVNQQSVRLIRMGEEQGSALSVALGRILRGAACSSLGEDELGIREMREGLEAISATGYRIQRSYHLTLLAGALRDHGFFEEGLAVLGEAASLVEATGEHFFDAEIHRIRGTLWQAHESVDPLEIEASYRNAVGIAQGQQARSLELRAATSLARLWRDQGKRQQAHDLLAPVYGWFTEGFDTLDLKQAGGLLDELAS
jgi:class 3 adenylate cyclase/predicted ATPase